jgi:opacity protein-like surface antigen
MLKALALSVLGLMLGWTEIGHAQDAAVGDDVDKQLQSLKAELLDVTPGYYVSPLISASLLTGTVETNGVSLDFDGYLVRGGVAVGYQVAPLRVDVAATAGRSEIEFDGLDEKTKITFYDVIMNTYYDLPVNLAAYIDPRLPMITPYVGGGLGWIYLDFDDGGGDGGVIIQGLAGLGVRLSPRWTLDAGYRYFYIPRIEADGTDNEAGAHSVEGRLRYRF